MSRVFRIIAFLSCVSALATAAHAQSLSWSSYDTSGNLVNANAGTGGDLLGGNTVSFTIGTGQSLVFVTQNFVPLDLSVAGTITQVFYNVSAQGLGTGNGVNTRPMGEGLYNTAGTGGVADDFGYFSLWNANGPFPEMYTHGTNNGANLFQGTQQGQGTVNTAPLQDFVTYQALIRLRNSGGNIGLGNNSPSWPFAGAGWTDGASVTNSAYINPTTPPGGFKTFNEFAIYYSNTSGADETINLDSITLTPVAVPEPSTIAFVGMGLLGLLSSRRFRK
jgi:hypothetical protein